MRNNMSTPETSATPGESNQLPISIDENQSTNSTPMTLGETDRHRSIVWNHFKRKTVDGKIKAECNECKKMLVGGAKSGTSHLHEHLKSCPRKKYKNLKQCLLVSNQLKKDTEKTMENWRFVQEEGRRDLANMIVLHEYPLSMVEHHVFQKYCHTLQPMFKMVSRNTLKNDILQIYETEKEKTMKLLEKTKSRVAITTDMWTSNNQRKGYMAITTHFIDNSWTLQSRMIRY